ncbi:MAG TPA: alpha-amylase family glycosyl hydrolase, partial [Anaerolineales bacterium]|nr:alpha-amylase family glycosyl hydrolase [Anaerolineales bacterium]
SNWTFDPVRGQYFWHRFFSHQPDLNYDNPEVQRAMLRIVQDWIDLGVDGFRIDAPPYLYEREGTNCENLPETHAYLKRLRAFVDAYAPGTFLLSESNMWPEEVIQYFGDGDEMHMNYHFPLMPRIFMALARADCAPILSVMARTPELPAPCQWGTFLRCHDELTLEMVTPEERTFMWNFYAPEPRMRLNLGIRRRLAPLLDNDRRRIEVVNSMLLTLIGSPFIYYGDEIGMGDNIWLNDRDGVRTPMQWDASLNAGFSDAPAERLYAPVIEDAVYGYQQVTVAAQGADDGSLWHWMQRALRIRKQHPVFSRGTLCFLEPENPAILAYLRSDGAQMILVINNLSAAPQKFALDLSAYTNKVPRDLLADITWDPIGASPYPFTLTPYGYHWLVV